MTAYQTKTHGRESIGRIWQTRPFLKLTGRVYVVGFLYLQMLEVWSPSIRTCSLDPSFQHISTVSWSSKLSKATGNPWLVHIGTNKLISPCSVAASAHPLSASQIRIIFSSSSGAPANRVRAPLTEAEICDGIVVIWWVNAYGISSISNILTGCKVFLPDHSAKCMSQPWSFLSFLSWS